MGLLCDRFGRTKMRHLIIGLGEIGKAVYGIFPDAQTLDIEKKAIESPIDVMHICFTYGKGFLGQVLEYKEKYNPDHVVIWSTVPIGKTKKIKGAVHAPVEGKHPDLEDSIRQMERWLGYNDEAEKYFYINLFNEVGIKVKPVENSDFTEALKLLSTTEYGINIEFARYKKHVADELGMDYELTKEFNIEYNKLYKTLGLEKKYQKFVLDAPEGDIGGHCIVPNAQLLGDQYPSIYTRIIGGIK